MAGRLLLTIVVFFGLSVQGFAQSSQSKKTNASVTTEQTYSTIPSGSKGTTRFYDKGGSSAGRAEISGKTTRYYAKNGSSEGKAEQSGNTTRFYGKGGSSAGRAEINGKTTRFYNKDGSYAGRAETSGNTTRFYGKDGSSAGRAEAERRRQRKHRIAYRVNEEVVCAAPSSCPRCGGRHVIGHGTLTRLVYDLRLMKAGVKRWIIRYKSHRYFCKGCRKTFVPNTLESLAPSPFGPILRAWCVYHLIAERQSQRSIHDTLDALFGYKFRGDIAGHMKRVAARRYRPAYVGLLEGIRTGSIVHADETKASVKGECGYVWAFTNMEDVIYIYRPTREGDVVKEILDGFGGVLISDFYTAYDSVPCAHQKCLIHLMRDINDDVFKNPFDEELKLIAQWFTETLRPIVETIDRYGLKRRHLNKHKASARRFVEKIDGCTFHSANAVAYQKRIRKNSDMLFTFLDHDGVPWNNNNAEHAIKRFAFLRNAIGGSSSGTGLEDYLILLSVYETLRLRGVSFFEFLASGAVDTDGFEERRR
jgi:hypothetical protein